MQKKTLALALSALFALPVVAHADVVIYGFMAGSVDSAKATGTDTSKIGKAVDADKKPVLNSEYDRTTRVNSDNSRIGFKGSEDLGNGLKAVWQIENSLSLYDNGGGNTWAGRNSFVGLSDATFGTVVLGRFDSAYKRLTDTGQDLMVNTTAGNQGSGQIFSRGEARYINSVSYTSQNWNGLVFGASVQADETDTGSNDRWSIAGQYTLEGLKVGLGYDQQKNAATGVDTRKFTKLSASYKIADTLLIAGYEWARDDLAVGSDLKQDDWTVGVQQNFGKASVRLSYGALGKLDGKVNADDYKASQWILGGTYNLSKMTQVYAYATKIDNNSAASVNFQNNAVYTGKDATGKDVLAAGNDPQAIGAGIRVNF
ncbi:porin [Craterilacuibacter sp. RT1T]|uniref:porin n=1 Tax=Craterilacuibacter sp. RT1T TaxID=2942211 RepID=UPI0020C0A9EA|nr:porin [Craterilacuibacter sp. RT1T]MCL6262881.1 porin [Craterilacuibacter sp. RT1T]